MLPCKLIIRDEVNIKLEGLPAEVRRNIADRLKFEIPYARHLPQFKLGRWDGTTTFFGIGGNGYLNHLDVIIDELTKNNFEIVEIEDNRVSFDFDFPQITENYWADQGKVWPKGHPIAGQPIMLRDYQIDAINNYLRNPQSLAEISTGAGKCCSGDTMLRLESTNSELPGLVKGDNVTSFRDFFDMIEKYKGVTLNDHEELAVGDLGVYVPTPSGKALVNYVIKKENLAGLMMTLKHGSVVECARGHILSKNGKDVYAYELSVGDYIDTIDGHEEIISILPSEETTFYDIGIDAPHLYYDAHGVLHHNTILTATLSSICEKYGRTLVIVPNKSLVLQTEEDYKNVGLDVGVYFGDRKELGKKHTIITWQSLSSIEKRQRDPESIQLADFLADVVCVMVDEAHSAKGNVLQNLLSKNLHNAPIRWGLTGTVPKDDLSFNQLLSVLGPVIGQVAASDLQDKGVLSSCHIHIKQLVDPQVFKSYHDEYKFLTTSPSRLNYVADLVNEVRQTGNTLVLVDRISTGEQLLELIPGSSFVSGQLKMTDRKELYDGVNTGDTEVLVATYQTSAVGINIPRIFNLVMIEPGKSFVKVIQSIGRGIRKAADKDHVNVYDICSTCKYSKRHLTERKRFYKEAKYQSTIEKVNHLR